MKQFSSERHLSQFYNANLIGLKTFPCHDKSAKANTVHCPLYIMNNHEPIRIQTVKRGSRTTNSIVHNARKDLRYANFATSKMYVYHGPYGESIVLRDQSSEQRQEKQWAIVTRVFPLLTGPDSVYTKPPLTAVRAVRPCERKGKTRMVQSEKTGCRDSVHTKEQGIMRSISR